MILNVCWRFQRKLNFVFLLFICHILSTYGQGYFPKLVDLAELKPITSTSTCGATTIKYCESSTRQTSLQTCFKETCKFGCCANCGSSKPVPSDLAERSNKIFGVTQDGDPRNGTIIRSFRFQGNSHIQPLRVPTIDYVNPGFTISVWIKQKKGNKGTIISKDENIAPDYGNIFQVVIQDYNLMFYYRPTIGNVSVFNASVGNASVASYTLLQSQSQKLQADEWHLITVAVINKSLSYYIDGELMNADVTTLTGSILDSGGGVRIGQKHGGDAEWQYEGLMQDIFIYDRALTNREAIEAFTGVLPVAYVASSCRCPPTHPKINVAEPAKCLKNLEGDLDTVSRLADTAHPIEFANDGDTLSFWLSEITNNVTIDINLSYSGLQVFYIVLTFYGPVPGGLEILRSTDNGRTFHPWQYFAEECVSSFRLQNNGPLTQPDSVNCVQYVKPLRSSREVLTFQTEYPPPPGSNIPVRPFGQNCSNLYCSESLLQFLKATHVKFRFHNHTLVQNAQHKYYGLQRVLVTGRCECFGHASSISYVEGNATHPGHCVCDCHSSTNTEGETCNRCKPLYNSKPFQRGDQDDSYPCVKCECNEHASSCVYNQSLDTSPNSRTQGGGGVCIDCQHNTTGRFCEACKERFYRESGKSLKSPDVCTPCACEGPGVQSGKLDCVKDDSDSNVLAGQCECKANTQGRQCDVCENGYFDLKASHSPGCVACGCVLDGTKNRNISCHTTTGQCDCKDRVTGTKCDTCMPGFWGLSSVEPLGCKKCDCNLFGTTAGNVSTCNAISGQCSCKPGSIGRKCDQCEDGYHSLTQNGCSTCNCSAVGTQPSLLNKCDKNTGRCDCKLNVEGNNCDQCKQGFYNLSQSNPQGCAQCACDTKGTVGGSGQCEQQSGNCTCKPLVIGQSCNQCKLGTYGLNQSNPNGCQPCNCFPKGTRDGDTKRADELQCSSDGKCFCLSNVSGLRCDSCVAEYYWNPTGQGCAQCQCKLVGSVGTNCNDTGQCTCKANIAGRQCDRCVDGYYGFITAGSCTSCNCNASGSLTNKCNERGVCDCKDNVKGDKCDQCKNGTVNLQQNNKYGCSGAPLGENAMNVGASPLNSSSVVVSWSPPQTPQGVITSYIVYKYQPPSSLTAVRAAEAPGSQRQGVVPQLTPYTEYKFTVKACNSFACSGHSPEALARTLPAAPEGQGRSTVLSVDSSTVYIKWSQPQTPNGPLPPSYNLSRAYSALYFPPPLVTAGVHFPGLGYYKFPSDFVRPGAINDIHLWFRTQYAVGLLLFLASDGSQTDMLAVELRDGKPWLIFDCQDGPAAFTISQSVRFDDGEWHQLKIKRVSRRGTLTVDGYQTSQDSPGTATVIPTNTGVYIGGLPSTFAVLRQDTGNAKLKRTSFIGCIRGITSDLRQLDWTSALEAVSVEPQRNGCPARDKKAAILLRGGGYITIDSAKVDILTSDIFSFTLIFRTQLSSGLLLFAYGPTTTFAIQLAHNQVEIMYVTSSVQGTVTVAPSSGDICDGRWHNLNVTNFLGLLTVIVDTYTVVRPGITNLVIQNIFYIGGVPWGSPAEAVAQQAGVNVESSFGGCMMVQSAVKEIDYQKVVTAMHNADLDGCLPESTIAVSGQVGKCLPFNSSVVFSGKTEMFNDSSVDVFTDYLYRVESYHVGTIGSAKSAWIASRSGQGAPAGLQAPTQLIPLPGGKIVRVAWTPPERPNGVISEYRILSYRVHPPQSTPDETVIPDTSVLNATIIALQPYTIYEIRIQAFTVGGSAVGPGKNVTTEESVPDSVPGATAVRRPKELEVHWSEPGQLNGIIIQYNLTLDGQMVYSGTNNNFTIQGLQVYTEYALQLTACTRIGCAQGPVVRIRTSELAPEGVKSPRVLVRGRTEVEVSWEVPRIINGAIVRYEILFATSDVLSAYVSKFNATPDVFDTVIGNLTAGTLYYVRVRPFTGGGGTFSNATQVTTHEDVPDDMPAPIVVADSPYALSVIMLPPDKPNGVITRYELYQDSIRDPVLNVTQLTNYTARSLAPYSRHTFRVRACTAQGCAYGALAVAFTQEIAPNGTVTLKTSIRNATAVNARWTHVAVPNGKLFYSLMVYGRFIVQGSVELETEQRIETAISVEEAEKDFIYNGLLPHTTYTFWVNASNSVGFVLSNNVTDSTPEGMPKGFGPPVLYSLSRTEIRVRWNPPTEPNGVVILYKIYVNDILWTDVPGVERQGVASGLEPSTYYVIKVAVCTTHGCTMSDPASATTDAAVDITRNTSAVVNVTEGESLTVNCSIGTNYPEWSRKDRGDVNTETRKAVGVLLHIEKASIADTGVYVCEHGKDRHTIWIQVLVQVEVEMELVVENYVFKDELKNKSTPFYKETEKNFTTEMDKVHKGVTPGYVRTDVLGFKKGSVQVDFKIVIVLVTNDPENATDLPDVKAKTAQRVVVKAKTGFVERLQVKKVIVKTVPLEPGNVEIFGIDSNELSVRWNPSEDADSFQIQKYLVEHRKFEEKLYTSASQPASDDKTQYTIRIQPLEPETTYMIRVGAVNAYGSNYNDESAHKTDATSFAWWIIVVVVLIILLVLVILVVLIVYKRKRDREREARQQVPRIDALDVESPTNEIPLSENKYVKILTYSYSNDAYKPSEVSWEEIPYEKLKLLDELGSGAFGVVYKGEYLQENGNVLPCAVKSLKPAASGQEVRDLYNELKIMNNVGYHPNLVNLIGACTEDGHLLVVLEIAENGSLIDFLKKSRQTDQSYEINSGLTEQMKTRIATDVARGMAHLAKCRCIHRDLAARNVLLGKDYIAKVSDYGMARDVYEDLMYKKETQGKLPVKWMAIESLQTYTFTIESDVWSYGVVLWEVESGGLKPYAGLNTTELIAELKKGYRLEKPDGCSEEMYQVMRSCWNPNPSARPTFDQLLIQLESEIGT